MCVCVSVCSYNKFKQKGWANLVWCRKHISGPWTKQLDRKLGSNLSWWEGQTSELKQQQTWAERRFPYGKIQFPSSTAFVCAGSPNSKMNDKHTKLYFTNTKFSFFFLSWIHKVDLDKSKKVLSNGTLFLLGVWRFWKQRPKLQCKCSQARVAVQEDGNATPPPTCWHRHPTSCTLIAPP